MRIKFWNLLNAPCLTHNTPYTSTRVRSKIRNNISLPPTQHLFINALESPPAPPSALQGRLFPPRCPRSRGAPSPLARRRSLRGTLRDGVASQEVTLPRELLDFVGGEDGLEEQKAALEVIQAH